MKINFLTTPDPACNTFVAQRADGKIGYLPAWADNIAKAAHLKAYYLVARDSKGVHGVLSLAHVRSFLFGNFMVSQPFSNYGGPLTDSKRACDGLFNRAVELALDLGCETIELRNIKPLPYDLEPRLGKMCMHLRLAPNPEEIWKSFKPKVRNQVRKAEKSGITAIDGKDELLDDFYKVYSTRMHQLGTPAYPRKVMQNILRAFPENSRIFVVRLGELCVGAGFTVHLNGFVEIPWAATLVKYNSFCPNNLLYWSIIKHYCLAGAKCFDFGRCTAGGPTHQFKKQWGPEPVELHYQYWTRPGHKLSILSPDNPKYKRRVETWKKLPFWLARLIGPHISRSLP